MTLRQFLVLIALGVVLALIWVLIHPALAIVLGIGAVVWHLAGGEHAFQASLDQSLWGVVHRIRS